MQGKPSCHHCCAGGNHNFAVCRKAVAVWGMPVSSSECCLVLRALVVSVTCCELDYLFCSRNLRVSKLCLEQCDKAIKGWMTFSCFNKRVSASRSHWFPMDNLFTATCLGRRGIGRAAVSSYELQRQRLFAFKRYVSPGQRKPFSPLKQKTQQEGVEAGGSLLLLNMWTKPGSLQKGGGNVFRSGCFPKIFKHPCAF